MLHLLTRRPRRRLVPREDAPGCGLAAPRCDCPDWLVVEHAGGTPTGGWCGGCRLPLPSTRALAVAG